MPVVNIEGLNLNIPVPNFVPPAGATYLHHLELVMVSDGQRFWHEATAEAQAVLNRIAGVFEPAHVDSAPVVVDSAQPNNVGPTGSPPVIAVDPSKPGTDHASTVASSPQEILIATAQFFPRDPDAPANLPGSLPLTPPEPTVDQPPVPPAPTAPVAAPPEPPAVNQGRGAEPEPPAPASPTPAMVQEVDPAGNLCFDVHGNPLMVPAK